MDLHKTPLPGVLLIEPRCFGDARGFFLESYQAPRYHAAGIVDDFVQDNHSRSSKGVLRGMHYTVKRPQAQIVTVMRGRIFDAVVDLRPGSETFGRWAGFDLSDEGPRQLYMAPGFAHGYCVLSGVADLHYKVSELYDAGDEGGLVWNDPDVGIAWPISNPQVGARDAAYPHLKELDAARLPHMTAGQSR